MAPYDMCGASFSLHAAQIRLNGQGDPRHDRGQTPAMAGRDVAGGREGPQRPIRTKSPGNARVSSNQAVSHCHELEGR
jgi:hypothetical protein